MVFGPFPADGFFGSNQYEKYDAILATYHDQGLIPFKTLSFGKGVNYTAGLNKIRTSPDHGTAYEIAGKNMADFNSFKEAVYLAIDIFHSRNQYEIISQNPMKIREKQEEKILKKKMPNSFIYSIIYIFALHKVGKIDIEMKQLNNS